MTIFARVERVTDCALTHSIKFFAIDAELCFIKRELHRFLVDGIGVHRLSPNVELRD